MSSLPVLPARSVRAQELSKSLWNEGRSIDAADFFTFGYAGRSTDEILEVLKLAGVATVIDIRHTPLSMYKPDFSKRNLERIVRRRGFQYLHLPELGVPKIVRNRAAHRGSRKTIWDWYDRHVVERYFAGNLDWFLNVANHPFALMCVELDPEECHRHRLFQALENLRLRGYDL